MSISGGVRKPCSPYDIQAHIKNKTSFNPKLSFIQQKETSGDILSFKVTVPVSKLDEIISESVWADGVKAEVYKHNRPNKSQKPKGGKQNNSKRDFNRGQTFRKQNQKPHIPNRPAYQNRSYTPHTYDQVYREQYQPNYWY